MQELKDLIESSDKILITSHISPDADAVCSSLLLGQTLKENYTDKQICIALEEVPSQDLKFLRGYSDLTFGELSQQVESFAPRLLIIVDSNNFKRCSRDGAEKLQQLVNERQIKTAIIDHHEPVDKIESDVYINQSSPACTQDIYEVCFEHLGLKKPEGYQHIALLGIVSDTARFKYENPKHRETFKIVDETLDAGASIERLESDLRRYKLGVIKVIAELAKNLRAENGYSFSYISDDFTAAMPTAGVDNNDIKVGSDIFNSEYIRNIENNHWGFIIYPEFWVKQGQYSVSLRSEGEAKDVSAVAATLGGGGHKPAAGAKIQAPSVEEALEMVKSKL